MKKTTELLEFIFGGEPEKVTIFDEAVELEVTDYSEIDEDQLLLSMPDAMVDLVADGKAYAVVTDQLPTENANLHVTKGSENLHVYMLETPVDPDDVPEAWDLVAPLPGLGWEYITEGEAFYELSDLVSFQASEEEDQADDETVQTVPVETAVEDGAVAEAETVEEDSEPEMMFAAEILGEEHPDLEDFLVQPMVFMTGDMYGQNDRRNTRPGKWKRVEMPIINWMEGGELRDGTEWGLCRHPVHADKGGSSIVPSDNFDGERTADATKTMYAIGIDIDTGNQLDSVIEKLIERGIFSIVYTTHSHLKDRMTLKSDMVQKKLKIKETPTRPQVQEFLRNHHKDSFPADFINNIEIIDAKHHTKDGLHIVLGTPPVEKFRVIIPLAKPVELAELADSIADWKEVWADAVAGVCVNWLEADFDTASCDINRLFYSPRHPEGAEYYSAVIMGKPLAFEDIEPYSKEKYARERKAPGDPFLADSGTSKGAGDVPMCTMPKSGNSLNKWHSDIGKERFLIADVIETYCEDRQRHAGGERAGTAHIECPFEHEHSTSGGTATMVMNPDANKEEVWTVFCRHDSCSGRHKLEFLQEMLEQEWFDEELLTDETFVLPAADGEDEDEPEETEEEMLPGEEEAAQFGKDVEDEDLIKFMKRHVKLKTSQAQRGAITTVLTKNTGLSKTQVNKMWREAENQINQKKIEEERADPENFEGQPVVNIWDELDLVKWAKGRITAKNADNPFLFHYMEGVARVTQNSEGYWRIKLLNEAEFSSELNRFTKWTHQTIMGDQVKNRGVLAPKPIVQQIFNDLDTVYPPLRAVTGSPSFTAEGELIVTPGYDPSGIYYQPDITLDVPTVPTNPTEEDIDKALRLLVEEILADFPFAGLTRDEIVEQCLNGDGVPAVTHAIATLLLFFCRDMIDGPTPGHLYCKPAPGTGASLLTEVLSIIGNGDVVAASELPDSKEELNKTITAFLIKGSPMIYFDNINHSIDSGGLASALTASRHEARILGKSQMVDTPVRAIFVLTGNNVQMTSELLRRCVLIDLDAQMAEPESRSGWRHEDVRAWAREHRGELVWACLTLIQNWIAKDKPKYSGLALNSYENWSYVMGGIMEAADIGGFLGNREELKQMSADGRENDIVYLLEEWWEHVNCQKGDDWINARVTFDDKGNSNPSLIDLAIQRGVQLSIRKQKGADDELTYNPQNFENFLTKYNKRVFALSSGVKVGIEKSAKATKNGHQWRLVHKDDG